MSEALPSRASPRLNRDSNPGQARPPRRPRALATTGSGVEARQSPITCVMSTPRISVSREQSMSYTDCRTQGEHSTASLSLVTLSVMW